MIDLQREIPNAKCFSRTNLYYMKKMYTLYSPIIDDASLVINGAVLGTSEIVQQDVGQNDDLATSLDHILRKESRDNPTIGLLICKEKDRIQAQYALESSSQPLGILEYELEKFYPEKVEGTIPTIEELEAKLSEIKPRKELQCGK